jgi:hypothetical protein
VIQAAVGRRLLVVASGFGEGASDNAAFEYFERFFIGAGRVSGLRAGTFQFRTVQEDAA